MHVRLVCLIHAILKLSIYLKSIISLDSWSLLQNLGLNNETRIWQNPLDFDHWLHRLYKRKSIVFWCKKEKKRRWCWKEIMNIRYCDVQSWYVWLWFCSEFQTTDEDCWLAVQCHAHTSKSDVSNSNMHTPSAGLKTISAKCTLLC